MKQAIVLLLSLLLAGACAVRRPVAIREVKQEEDSVHYELIVFDSGFETWYLTRAKPLHWHEQSWYENWNRQYVQAWNYHRLGYRHRELLDGSINYEPSMDYGPEINHKLFYYFMYVEQVLKIPILENGPRSW